jgi:hypothetical protein
MTFEELEEKLPNGFHDSKVRWMKPDFINSSLTVGMELLVGLPDAPNSEEYRVGTLKVEPFYLFFIEPPDPTYSFRPDGSPLNIDGDPAKPGQNPDVDRLLVVLPQDVTSYRFFLIEWNAFVYVAGRSVSFLWDDGGSLKMV